MGNACSTKDNKDDEVTILVVKRTKTNVPVLRPLDRSKLYRRRSLDSKTADRRPKMKMGRISNIPGKLIFN